LAREKGELMVMEVIGGERAASGGPGTAQCFPPGLDEVYEFAMVRLDAADASRRAWLTRQEARRRERTFLQRLFGEEMGRTKKEARISLMVFIAIAAFLLLLVWSLSDKYSEPTNQRPHVQ
jgi:hypothetical protein